MWAARQKYRPDRAPLYPHFIVCLIDTITLPEESQCITQRAKINLLFKSIPSSTVGAAWGGGGKHLEWLSGVSNYAEVERRKCLLACLKYVRKHNNKVVPHSHQAMVIILMLFTIFWLCSANGGAEIPSCCLHSMIRNVAHCTQYNAWPCWLYHIRRCRNMMYFTLQKRPAKCLKMQVVWEELKTTESTI